MFNKQNSKGGISPGEVETIIGPSVKVKGNFHGEGNVIIEGVLDGGVKTKNNIIIGESAKIAGNIEAKEAQINGSVKGNIKVGGYLEVGEHAKILGDIEANSLSIARGAVLNGKCTMKGQDIEEDINKEPISPAS